MLVVIGIIVVLMAILFPVFASVRRKARETQCWNNLHQLSVALKMYRDDHGRYPGPASFDGTRFVGGFSDLYPDYVDNTKVLVCPEDMVARQLGSQVKDVVYCSYNGKYNVATHLLTESYYNYNGYDVVGDTTSQPFPSTGVDNGGSAAAEAAWQAAILSAYTPTGRTLRDGPRLKNRSAPGNTIITHCVNHRGSTPNDAQARDFVMRVDGSKSTVRHTEWDQDPDANGAKVSPWIEQTQ
jgi:type II secretory pathway pseudopilin PulG